MGTAASHCASRVRRCYTPAAPYIDRPHEIPPRPPADQLRQCDRFVLPDALSALHRLVVPFDLRVDRVAQPQPLVSQLIDILGIEVVVGGVDVSNGFEEAEWKEGVNSREHVRRLRDGLRSWPNAEVATSRKRPQSMLTRVASGLAVAAAISVLAWRARSLTRGGALTATTIGTLGVAVCWNWGVLLILYFISSSALSRIGRARK